MQEIRRPSTSYQSLYETAKISMLKEEQQRYLRKRPKFIETIQHSLEERLTEMNYSSTKAIAALSLIENCRNYIHSRAQKAPNCRQPRNTANGRVHRKANSAVSQQIEGLINSCEKQNCKMGGIGEEIAVFEYVSHKLDFKLDKMRARITRQEAT